MSRKRSRSKARIQARATPDKPAPPPPVRVPTPPEWLVRVAPVALLALAVAAVAATRSQPMWLAAAPQRAAWTYEAANGATYPYLSGMDSYSWVRKARNYLATGSPCDVETADDCRDLLRHAPVGSTMPYADSFHIRAIAWLHRVLARFDPERPIDASAFWVQVVVGTLGVVPAWLIGCRLGGPLAGLLAALLIGLHPEFFERSLGADNDVWNVVLPLYAAAAVLLALADTRRWRRIAWAAVAAGVFAMHAAIWRGWTFGFVVLVAGSVASALVSAIRAWTRSGGAGLVSATAAPLLVAACVVGGTLVLTAMVPHGAPRVTEGATAAADPSMRSADFPDALRDVGELRVLGVAETIEQLGGPIIVLGGLLGLLLLVLPNEWASETRPGLLVAIWLGAALYMTLDAQRWILLAVAPVGLAYAAGASHLVAFVRRHVRAPAAPWVAMAAVAVPVALCAYDGARRARSVMPTLTDAWWNSLRAIDASAPPNAIVNATWPHGYWIEYIARRGVTADGSSLRTHVPHWMGRALLTSDPAEALGLFRMLNCGSDAWPEPEGRLGAYERLRAAGADHVHAHDLVLALARLDRAGADRLLQARAYPAETRAQILEATHCTPPSAYVVLSHTQARQPSVRRQGTWDPRRAAIAHRLRMLPEAEAIAAAVGELGLPEAEARAMYSTARRLRSDAELDQFIAPTPGYFTTDWVRCAREGTSLVCNANLRRREGLVLERFTYPVAAGPLERGTLHFREGERATQRPPDALVVADAGGVRDLEGPAASDTTGAGVLVDLVGSRAIFGPPYLIRSMLTRLVWLGRAPGFEKVDQRQAAGERVTTWRIKWPPAT